MHPFTYVRATDEATAGDAVRASGGQFIAGGTTLVDLMRLDVMRPPTLVDVSRLSLRTVDPHAGGLRVGAMVRNSDLAYHPLLQPRYAVLSEALLAGASPQIRNMASVGGNLLQRTRCSYFRDISSPCNKRQPGAGCSALEGYARMHAILGGSGRCIAVNPSDMCVALVALGAVVVTRGPDGREREIPIDELHTLPGEHPEKETVLEPGELVLYVDLPAVPDGFCSRYVKVRDRASYAFALASAAVAVTLEGQTLRHVRVALGGVATKPWRAVTVEQALTGQRATIEAFRAAAESALAGAAPRRDNAFKVTLAKRTLVRALSEATGVS